MNQIATTIEQSKKLIELGIDVNTADMYYYKENVFNNALSTFNGALLVKGNSKPEVEYTIPAWSLSALIELMPKHLLDDDEEFALEIYITYKNKYAVCYQELFPAIHSSSLFNVVFQTVCYLLKNKLI